MSSIIIFEQAGKGKIKRKLEKKEIISRKMNRKYKPSLRTVVETLSVF